MATLDTTRLQILDIAKTYGCMCQYNAMITFFSNAANNQATYDAVQKYGVPPKNGIDKDGNFHSGWCSWDLGMLKFWCACLLYSNYPKFDFKDPKNCDKSKNLKISLDEEKVFIDNEHVTGGGDCGDNDIWFKYASIVINDYMSDVNGAMANLNCTKVIDQQQQQEQIDIIDKQANIDTAESKTSNVGIYLVYGVAVIIIGVVVKKIFFKSK